MGYFNVYEGECVHNCQTLTAVKCLGIYFVFENNENYKTVYSKFGGGIYSVVSLLPGSGSGRAAALAALCSASARPSVRRHVRDRSLMVSTNTRHSAAQHSCQVIALVAAI